MNGEQGIVYVSTKKDVTGYPKPLSNFVTAVIIQSQKTMPITVKARGKAISRAVDLCEKMKNDFPEQKWFVKDIKFLTEEKKITNGKEIIKKVSVIHVILDKEK